MGNARLLVVDDEPRALASLRRLLTGAGYSVQTAVNGQQALEIVADSAPELIVTDLQMPKLNGMQLLARVRELNAAIPVLVVTAAGDAASAVAAIRAGAEDYLTKPIDFDTLLLSVERTLQRRELLAEAENLRRQLDDRDQHGLPGLIGASQAMQRVYRTARQVAPSRANLLITGESGTGKSGLARAIHALSPRHEAPFVAVSCATLADTLLESELFGHEQGAFTGADKPRRGRFEQANGGTLFLDEVGEIPMVTQAKLLRVLQERTFERVGGSESIALDVRVIAATNRDLVAELSERRFRQDLYYRLNVVHLEMPPLRQRGQDVMVLAEHFLAKFARENQRRLVGFDDAARSKLTRHPWPGNVRELENALEHAVVLSSGDLVSEADLPFAASPPRFDGIQIPGSTLAELEKYAILATLEAENGSTARAAEVLDVSVRTIQYRLQNYGILPSRHSS